MILTLTVITCYSGFTYLIDTITPLFCTLSDIEMVTERQADHDFNEYTGLN